MPSKKRPEARATDETPGGTAGKQKAWNVAHKADAVLHPKGIAFAGGYAGFGDKGYIATDIDAGNGVEPKKNLRSLKKAVKSVVPPDRSGDMRRVPKINPNDPEGHI